MASDIVSKIAQLMQIKEVFLIAVGLNKLVQPLGSNGPTCNLS